MSLTTLTYILRPTWLNSLKLSPLAPARIQPIHTTDSLFGAQQKKRRRLDPALLRVRVEKKIKKYDRDIAKLENEPRQPIPILEYQFKSNADFRDLESRPSRSRQELGLTESQLKATHRLWNFYRLIESRMQDKSIRKVFRAQNTALEVLKRTDIDLHNKTMAIDDVSPIPYNSSHMRKESGANPNYTCPDGYIKDISKDWVM